MKQLSIFKSDKKPQNKFKFFFDGASRNNPGPAGAGIIIKKNDQVLISTGYYLGAKTNNQAEYLAFILGLFILKKEMQDNDELEINADSELIVKQMKREYKVKNLDLKQFFALANKMLFNVNYKIQHVYRTENTIADKNANIAIDKKIAPPYEFIQFLYENNISI